ncbi:hypothetical protein CBF29_12190 [Vagococcus elongatus]|uniref:Uncharacterized protein n=1 Tax=Vagococcus elongatus TaxID=180344 RepID=A0A430AM07_9ENTE|nr:hypothetical protein CBF29_12190 [Vagococcus elongatus]
MQKSLTVTSKSSFSTTWLRSHYFSYIRKSLHSTIPVDPLASLDIFGQQRVSIQEPHLTDFYLTF